MGKSRVGKGLPKGQGAEAAALGEAGPSLAFPGVPPHLSHTCTKQPLLLAEGLAQLFISPSSGKKHQAGGLC